MRLLLRRTPIRCMNMRSTTRWQPTYASDSCVIRTRMGICCCMKLPNSSNRCVPIGAMSGRFCRNRSRDLCTAFRHKKQGGIFAVTRSADGAMHPCCVVFFENAELVLSVCGVKLSSPGLHNHVSISMGRYRYAPGIRD